MDSGCFMVGATVITLYETIFLGVCCHFLVCLYNIRTYIHTYLPTYIETDSQAGRQTDIHTYCIYIYMGVSRNGGTPKSSILIGFSIINHPFWDTTILGNTHIYMICYVNHLSWASRMKGLHKFWVECQCCNDSTVSLPYVEIAFSIVFLLT